MDPRKLRRRSESWRRDMARIQRVHDQTKRKAPTRRRSLAPNLSEASEQVATGARRASSPEFRKRSESWHRDMRRIENIVHPGRGRKESAGAVQIQRFSRGFLARERVISMWSRKADAYVEQVDVARE